MRSEEAWRRALANCTTCREKSEPSVEPSEFSAARRNVENLGPWTNSSNILRIRTPSDRSPGLYATALVRLRRPPYALASEAFCVTWLDTKRHALCIRPLNACGNENPQQRESQTGRKLVDRIYRIASTPEWQRRVLWASDRPLGNRAPVRRRKKLAKGGARNLSLFFSGVFPYHSADLVSITPASRLNCRLYYYIYISEK